MKLQKFICAIAIASPFTPVNAQTIPAGDYIYEGGNGSLQIDADRSFSIETMGGNGHLCGLEGEVQGIKGVIPKSSCAITFKMEGADIRVAYNKTDACRYFCGARAGYDGLYIRPTPACKPGAVAASRKNFKRKYDQRNFAPAVDILSKVLNECIKVLGRFDTDWIRNDLALAQLRNGDNAACLRTLGPLTELASMSDDEIRGLPEPSFVDIFLSIAKATRTNLKLCKVAS